MTDLQNVPKRDLAKPSNLITEQATLGSSLKITNKMREEFRRKIRTNEVYSDDPLLIRGFKGDPGYHYHWVGDKLDKISRKEILGWEKVLDPLTNQPITKLCNSGREARFTHYVYMRIPMEYWEEILKAKDEDVRGTELAADAHAKEYSQDAGLKITKES